VNWCSGIILRCAGRVQREKAEAGPPAPLPALEPVEPLQPEVERWAAECLLAAGGLSSFDPRASLSRPGVTAITAPFAQSR